MNNHNIQDKTFKKEMHDILKRRKICITGRNIIIDGYLADEELDRDKALDNEDNVSLDFEIQKQIEGNIPSEFVEQCNFVRWFKSEHPCVVIMSIRNGGSRSPKERSEQLREGLHPGAADLYIPEWKLWIEFKKIKGGVLSEKQEIFRDYVLGIGDNWMLAYGCEKGKKQVINFSEQRSRNR